MGDSRIRAAYILAIGGILVAIIYVLLPRLLIQGTTSSSITLGPPATNPGTTQQQTAPQSSTPNCSSYEKTGGGNTKSYNVTVSNSCVMIVQAVEGHSVGSYEWNNGGIVALGPGSYSFTLVDGSYQIVPASSGNSVFCKGVQYLQSNNLAFGYGAHPLPGWGGC